MTTEKYRFPWMHLFIVIAVGFVFTGCATVGDTGALPQAKYNKEAQLYVIGPGDSVNVFVWGNPDLTTTVPVRPDGRITTPLIEDVQASGKTSNQLAREMEKLLAKYVKNPIVTVYVSGFVGRYSDQVRVIGEASQPQSLSFKENMTVLDVVIAVGGLTEFASGNSAAIIRTEDGKQNSYTVRLNDLVNKGDITANVDMNPGDILIIPESWF